jgi:hypothetical protein
MQSRFGTILSRDISAGLAHIVRTTLELTASTAQRQGASFQYSAIPVGYPKLAPFDFRAATMRPLFQYGYECAHAGRLWVSSRGIATDHEDGGSTATSRNIPCPADDEFIGRIAAR